MPDDYIPTYDSDGNLRHSLTSKPTFPNLGAFDDTNGDGVAELQPNHADFLGGDARNIGAFDGLEGTSKVMNGVVWGAHPDFATGQEAVDYANNNGYQTVVFTDGSYGPITLSEGNNIIGVGDARGVIFDGGTTAPGVKMAKWNRVINVRAETTSGGGTSHPAFHVGAHCVLKDCFIRESDADAIYMPGNESLIHGIHKAWTSYIDGYDINLTSNADYVIVANCIRCGVNNAGGSNNVIEGNV